MKSKTLANWLVLSFVLCIAGFWDSVFYVLGGTGLMVFSIWYIIKLQKQADWIYYGFLASFLAFMITVLASLETQIFTWIYWVFSIIAIIKLYKTNDKEKPGSIQYPE